MHTLEQMLKFLSQRIEEEMQNADPDLIEVAKLLADESHNYERTSKGPDPLREKLEEWHRRFGMPHRSTEQEDL